ncbi:50S ribosomal protein L33 [bacterium]|nr:50S ribosomal protein L33 [bacterium]
MQIKVTLVCTNCASRNYITKKNKASLKQFTLNKFCSKCNKVTLHKETR